MPDLRHLNGLDYVVVAVYMVMVIGVGLYVARFNKKTSDYFKGGGHIPWRLSAISLFVSGFSALAAILVVPTSMPRKRSCCIMNGLWYIPKTADDYAH